MTAPVVLVTEAHIAAGKPGRCSRCPVALAVADTTPGLVAVSVSASNIAITTAGEYTVYRTPARVALFIRAFDAGFPVRPFEFTLPGEQVYPRKAAA